MPVNHSIYTLSSICSIAAVETIETYKDNLSRYQDRPVKFIIMPFDMRYYDIEEEYIGKLDEEQFVGIDSPMIENLDLLTRHQHIITEFRPTYGYFKKGMEIPEPNENLNITTSDGRSISELTSEELIEYYDGSASVHDKGEFYRIEGAPDSLPSLGPYEFVERYPEYKEQVLESERDLRWSIVTISDANKRGVDQMIYAVISEFERQLSEEIANQYPDSSELAGHVRNNTLGRWKSDKEDGLDLHITEYMYLSTMIDITIQSEPILENLGYEADQFKNITEGVNQLRNKVMHPTKTLARTQNELQEALNCLSRVEEIITNA